MVVPDFQFKMSRHNFPLPFLQFYECLIRVAGPPSCFTYLVVGWCFTTTPALSSEFARRCEFGRWPVIIRRQKLARSKPAHHHLSAVPIVKFLRLILKQCFSFAEWSELVILSQSCQGNSLYMGSSSNFSWTSISTCLWAAALAHSSVPLPMTHHHPHSCLVCH